MTFYLDNGKPCLGVFSYDIVHHCNLNCKGCDHCSPIAKEEFVEVKTYKKDLKNIKRNFQKIHTIAILGGEPLLHPNLIDIIKISRDIFKKSFILIFTNAIKLSTQKKEFWEYCKKYKAEIVVTKYKINVNYDEIFDIAKKYEVKVVFEKEREKNLFHKIQYNIEGTENGELSHSKCYHAKACVELENSILYKCPIIPAARHFNDFFNTNMVISENDGLNLNKKLKKEEITKYFENPLPFCKYCNMDGREPDKPWGISKKEITEWT